MQFIDKKHLGNTIRCEKGSEVKKELHEFLSVECGYFLPPI